MEEKLQRRRFNLQFDLNHKGQGLLDLFAMIPKDYIDSRSCLKAERLEITGEVQAAVSTGWLGEDATKVF